MTLGCRAGILNEIPDASGWAPFALLGEKIFAWPIPGIFKVPTRRKRGKRLGVGFNRAGLD
jgi:hypothetical protein